MRNILQAFLDHPESVGEGADTLALRIEIESNLTNGVGSIYLPRESLTQINLSHLKVAMAD